MRLPCSVLEAQQWVHAVVMQMLLVVEKACSDG